MSSPKKNEVAYLQTIPRELMALILSRVAASFATDISNIKLSCKGFSEIAEDLHFYRHATLEKFPIIEWSPLCEKKQRFLKRCKESFNPEIWYREALVDFFDKGDNALALRKFTKAAEAGHIQALYSCCTVMILSGNKSGIEMMAKMKKDGTRVRWCCRKLIEELSQIWVSNPLLSQPQLICGEHHRRTNNSPREDEEEDELF
ncbi:putative F-box protein At1g67623 [Salvia splendens]|uniref:putative F-box protein At1g67623 n=1 Tax=Salvia splendens TaxID=180675 RepID=UPI001C26BAD9|nr:putative F-box protein At1g67623 [Salvia splendens]